jgi:ketosteroid isomerase-like protein
MSQENLERLRAGVAAFNRRDVEAFEALIADDVEIIPIRAALEGGTAYRGPGAVARWYAAVDESWEDLQVEIEEMRDGADRVLGLGRIRSRGRGSGVAIDVEVAALARFRDGLIVRLRIYSNRAEAAEAAGMSE